MQKVPVVVVGASGYTGAELIRLLLAHPRAKIVGLYAKTSAGQSLSVDLPAVQRPVGFANFCLRCRRDCPACARGFLRASPRRIGAHRADAL